MNYRLPDFRPVTQDELRQIWTDHAEMRRLVLEIERYRRLLAEIDVIYKTTHQAWRDKVGSELVALHLMKGMMHKERYRLGM